MLPSIAGVGAEGNECDAVRTPTRTQPASRVDEPGNDADLTTVMLHTASNSERCYGFTVSLLLCKNPREHLHVQCCVSL